MPLDDIHWKHKDGNGSTVPQRVSSTQQLTGRPQHHPALLLLWVTEVERNQPSFAKLPVMCLAFCSFPSTPLLVCSLLLSLYALGYIIKDRTGIFHSNFGAHSKEHSDILLRITVSRCLFSGYDSGTSANVHSTWMSFSLSCFSLRLPNPRMMWSLGISRNMQCSKLLAPYSAKAISKRLLRRKCFPDPCAAAASPRGLQSDLETQLFLGLLIL